MTCIRLAHMCLPSGPRSLGKAEPPCGSLAFIAVLCQLLHPVCHELLCGCPCVMQVSTQWPKELEAKQSRLAAVQATLNNGINTEVCPCMLHNAYVILSIFWFIYNACACVCFVSSHTCRPNAKPVHAIFWQGCKHNSSCCSHQSLVND